MPHGQKARNIKSEQYCNKFNKDFKKWATSKKILKKKKKTKLLGCLPLWEHSLTAERNKGRWLFLEITGVMRAVLLG